MEGSVVALKDPTVMSTSASRGAHPSDKLGFRDSRGKMV
jgi:hypothetical protein